MYKIIEEIKELLDDKTLTSYRIGKDTGISVQQVDRYRKTVGVELVQTLAINGLKMIM